MDAGLFCSRRLFPKKTGNIANPRAAASASLKTAVNNDIPPPQFSNTSGLTGFLCHAEHDHARAGLGVGALVEATGATTLWDANRGGVDVEGGAAG